MTVLHYFPRKIVKKIVFRDLFTQISLFLTLYLSPYDGDKKFYGTFFVENHQINIFCYKKFYAPPTAAEVGGKNENFKH